jgi:hypothetical protein
MSDNNIPPENVSPMTAIVWAEAEVVKAQDNEEQK